MIQLPHNCRYYLDQSREYALKKDYVRSLRMLYLAQTYADNSDDEYECFAEKLNIFDALGADVLAVCYESIAKQAFGEEMYAVLVNNAVAHKDAEQAAYYLDLYNSEGEDDIPRITPSDEREEEGGAASVPMEKLIADADGVSPHKGCGRGRRVYQRRTQKGHGVRAHRQRGTRHDKKAHGTAFGQSEDGR